jgi:hypothetical protein
MISWNELLAHARNNSMFVLVGGSALLVAFVPETYVSLAIVLIIAACVIMTYEAHGWTAEVKRKFGGVILKFVFAPTPMGSLLAALRENDVPISSIRTIKLMTASLRHAKKYWAESRDGDEPLMETIKRNPKMEVSIYGQLDGTDLETPHPRLKFFSTPEKLTEHINLVETEDHDYYLWYEKFHDVVRDKEVFLAGAYLIKIDQDKAAEIQAMFDCWHQYAFAKGDRAINTLRPQLQ